MAGLVTTPPTAGLPGVFAQELPSLPVQRKIPGDVLGVLFEASRGLPHLPTWIRSLADFNTIFGGRTPTQADATKLLSGYTSYLGLDNNRVMDVLGVRVGTAKMATAKITLLSGANPVLTLWASSPGTWANGTLVATVTAGQAANTWNLLLQNPATGEMDAIMGLPMADNAGAINQINKTANLVYATQPVLAEPAAAPTFSATVGGGNTVGAGTYYGAVTYANAAGQTMASAEAGPVTLATPGKLTLTVPALAGAASWDAYITAANGAPGSETFAATSTTFGAGVDIVAPWAASALGPPWGPIDQTGKLVAATTGAGYTAAIPTAGTFVFPTTGSAGAGNNGEGASSAQYLGSAGTPATGIYAFANLDIAEHPLYIAGAEGAFADGLQWAALAQYAFNNNCQVCVTYPQGTSSATAITSWPAFTATLAPLVAKHIKLAWPWGTIYDQTFARDIPCSLAPYLAALGAVTPANTSAANKPVAGLSGIEYTLASDSAATALAVAGVNALSGRITRPGVGFLTDYVGDGSYSYETRMKGELIQRATIAWADFSDIPNDAANRQRVEDTGDNVFRSMVADGILEDNPPTTGATPIVQPISTTGKTKANGAVGQQPSTIAAVGTAPTIMHWACECSDSNNLDSNGIPLSNMFIVDVQMRITRNADAVWLRYSAGVFQQITLPVAA